MFSTVNGRVRREPTLSAQEIREFRHKAGLTEEELSHLLRVTLSTISRWERGHQSPKQVYVDLLRGLMKRVEKGENLRDSRNLTLTI